MNNSRLFCMVLAAAWLVIFQVNGNAQDDVKTGKEVLKMDDVTKMLSGNENEKGLIAHSLEIEGYFKEIADLEEAMRDEIDELSKKIYSVECEKIDGMLFDSVQVASPYLGDMPEREAIRQGIDVTRKNLKTEAERMAKAQATKEVLAEFRYNKNLLVKAINGIEKEHPILMSEIGSSDWSYTKEPLWKHLASKFPDRVKAEILARALEKSNTFSIDWDRKDYRDNNYTNIPGGARIQY